MSEPRLFVNIWAKPYQSPDSEALCFLFQGGTAHYQSSDPMERNYLALPPEALPLAREIAQSAGYDNQTGVEFRRHPLVPVLLDMLVDAGCLTEEQVKNFRGPMKS